jgi:outer membrane protein insertion porin family
VEDTFVETVSGQADPSLNSPQVYLDYVNTFGDRTVSYPLTAAWQRDSRDSALIPTKGRYQKANFEVTAFGDLYYYRSIYQQQYYYPVSRSTTLAFNAELDRGDGLNGQPYPVFKNFFAGGIGSVRGYNSSSIGPRGNVTPANPNGDPVGGKTRIIGNVELQLPFSSTNKEMRWFTFFDAANVYAHDSDINLLKLRSSVGVGFSWVSPLGPLKFSYGKPLREQPGDNIQRWQFQMGTGF